jgi:hypothetical protein
MAKKEQTTTPHLRSLKTLTDHIASANLGVIDSREWKDEWAERWVVYADLVAFASRATRSESVVLNNIVRFDRASQLVAQEFPGVETRRFSDATFAITDDFHSALAFGVALSHTCLAFNREYLQRGTKQFFIHLIVPRITLAGGRALLLKKNARPESRFDGLNPRSVLAGSAIVRAHRLERHSAGGLLTIDCDGIKSLETLELRGHNGRVKNGLRRWIAKLADEAAVMRGEVFFHRRHVLDVPWLLLRPLQNDPGRLWAAGADEVDLAIAAYLDVWDKSVREYYSPQNFDVPLDVSKHSQAAIRHCVQVFQIAHGGSKPRYESVQDIL